jgi:hypothetical protein
MLHDNGASENFIDAKFLAEQLNRPQIHDRGWMTVTTAGQKSERLKRQQVWLEMRIPTTDSRFHNVKDWFTVFEMENRFDLVLGKSWMSKKENLHQVDHVGNTLQFLERDWTNLNPQGLPGYTVTTVLQGLRPGENRHTFRQQMERAARLSNIEILTPRQLREMAQCKKGQKRERLNLFLADIRPYQKVDVFLRTASVQNTEREEEEEEEPGPDSTQAQVVDSAEWREAAKVIQTWQQNLITSYADIFKPPRGVPPSSSKDFRIKLDPLAREPHRAPYRFTPEEKKLFEEKIRTLIENGWVQESQSRFASPVLFVPKADGTMRMCIDYRAINRITEKDRYPLPYIDDLLERLHGSKWFTKLDLADGYHQLRIHAADWCKTAFITPEGLWEYKVIPFGLANAPAAFMRHMHKVLEKHRAFVVIYVDDILIFSKTEEEHKHHVREVFDTLRKANMRLKESKCKIGTQETTFVGFYITKDGIHADRSKTTAISGWPTPATPSELRSFLGLAGYYRRFIKRFASIAAPLHDILSATLTSLRNEKTGRALGKGATGDTKTFAARWDADPRFQSSFDELRRLLASPPVLAILDPKAELIVRTDASNFAIGATLCQMQPWGPGAKIVERTVSFFSRKLSATERRYPTYDREMLAICDALDQWRCYINPQKRTTIFTDHASLQHILTQSRLTSRQMKYLESMQHYDYVIKYFPGAKNIVQDALSRRPDYDHVGKEEALLPQQLLATELHIAGVEEQRRELRDTLSKDSWFGPIIRVLRGEVLSKEAVLADVKAWRRAQARAKLFMLGEGDNLQHIRSGNPCLPGEGGFIEQVLREAHDSPFGGHFGVRKTLDAVQQRFYWPHMTASVKRWVDSCDSCARCKATNQAPYGLLQPLDIPNARWESIGIDFITKLPTSNRGNDSIVTFIDRLTKRAHWYAIRESISAEEFADLFVAEHIRLHGLPASIVSDRDARFTSDFWKRLNEIWKVKLRMSTAFHPQTDGQTEKANDIVQKWLRAFATNRQREWDRLLPMAEFAYNSTYHKTLRMTPFQADCGYNPTMPLDLILSTPNSHLTSEKAQNGVSFAEHLELTLKELRDNIEAAQIEQISEANKHRREHSFQVGDSVFLDTRDLALVYANSSTESRKLQHKKAGPFIITESFGNAMRLDTPAHWRMRVFNVSRLSPDRTDKSPSRNISPPPPLRVRRKDGQGEWEVESILAHRGSTAANLQYQVQWLGFPPESATWEPVSSLKAGAWELLKSYHEEKGLRVWKWMAVKERDAQAQEAKDNEDRRQREQKERKKEEERRQRLAAVVQVLEQRLGQKPD